MSGSGRTLGGSRRGVVSTANYAAREYGVRSATPIRKAWELSEQARKKSLPPIVFVFGHFRKYTKISKKIMGIVRENLIGTFPQPQQREHHPPHILPQLMGEGDGALEQTSVDECYFDLSFAGSFEKAKRIAERIKKEIKKKEQLTATVGIGPNKLIAKIASDFRKPDGLTIVPPEKVLDFLAPLSVRKIPGVGPKAEEKLKRLNVLTVVDAQKFTKEKLTAMFGKWGSELYRKFRGEDDSPVVVEQPSVSTFP